MNVDLPAALGPVIIKFEPFNFKLFLTELLPNYMP